MYYLDPKKPNAPVVNHNPNSDFPEHFHDNLELVYIESGTRIVTINGVDHIETTKSLTVVFPFIPHAYKFDSDGMYACIGVNPRFMSGLEDILFGCLPDTPVISAERLGRNSELIDYLFNCPRGTRPETLNLLASALILEISDELSLKKRGQGQLGSGILRVVAAQCSEGDFTIEKLSRLTGISIRTLQEFFSSTFGMTFSEFLRKNRLNAAMNLLGSSPGMSITEIAFESGFSSVRTFNRLFREEFGVSPSEFSGRRKQN